MAIRDTSNGNRERLQLTRCPLDWCGKKLGDRATKTSTHFLHEHLPEDFGLSPLGEVNTTQKPLFDDPFDGKGGVA